MKKVLHILLLIMTCTPLTYGQKMLTGKVMNEQKVDIIGCIITLQSSVDSSVIDYTYNTKDGIWHLSMPDTSVYLQFRYFGYHTLTKEIPDNESDTIIIDAVLLPNIHQLENIIVKANRVGIVQKGDTLKYNLNNYVTGQEKSLGDVIKKLPGMDISSESDINFNGQRVDVLLVENKDILNNLHKLATEGFKAEDIKSIHIIENYKNQTDRLSNKYSDKVAMDIKLTEEAKSQWKGSSRTEGGYKKKLSLDINTFNFDNKLSATVFGRYNNTGSALLSMNDYLSMQTSMMTTLSKNIANLDNILPKHFILPPDLKNNNDGLVAINLHLSKSKKQTSKLSIIANSLNRKTESNFERNYWNSGKEYNGVTNTNNENKILQSQYNETWSFKNNSQFIIDIPLFYNHYNNSQRVSGFFDNSATESYNNSKNLQWSVNPSFSFIHKISDHYHYNIASGFQYKSSTQSKNVTDIIELYQTSHSEVSQDINNINKATILSADIEYKRGKHSTGFGASYDNGDIQFSTYSGESQMFNTNTDFNRINMSLRAFYRFKNSKWIFEPKFKINRVTSQLNANSTSAILPKFEFLGKYSMGVLHFILLRGIVEKSSLPFNKSNSALVIEDGKTLTQSQIPHYQVTDQARMSISHFYYAYSNIRIHTLINFSQGKNIAFRKNIISNNYTTETWSILEREIKMSAKNTINKPLFLGKIRLKNNLLWSSSTRKVQDFNIDTNNFRWNIGCSTHFKSALNGEIGLATSHSISQNASIKTTFVRNSIYGTMILKYDKWRFEYKNNYHLNDLNRKTKNSFWQLDFSIDYSTNDLWTINLKSNDLLNLGGVVNISTNYQLSYIENFEFIRFPGYILIGIERKF
ncbi:MAG: hypothetical protein V3V00_03865 [Saprospiraceae bacterium]